MKRKPPDFLSDLFSDLRDRGLLPVVGLLVLCLVAVPFLLGGGGDDGAGTATTPATTASNGPLPGIETRPVVIASPAELRNYQERLAAFSSRNPFHQDLKKAKGTGGGTPAAAATATDTVTPATSSSSATSTTPSTSTAPPSDTTTTPTTPSTGNPDSSNPVTKLISTRIDVRVGTIGKTKRIDDVRSLDFLPDPKHPVVEYLRGDFDLTSAAFVVSSAVTETEGDGTCAPSPAACEFLMLDVGQEQTFQYNGERYRLKLIAVTRHESALDETKGGGSGNGRDSVRAALSAHVGDDG